MPNIEYRYNDKFEEYHEILITLCYERNDNIFYNSGNEL